MKLSQTKEIYEFIKEMGLSQYPSSLSPKDLEMDSPYVSTHRDISCTPERLQLHSHSFYEIIYCESGNLQYLVADKRYHIHAGDIILVPPGISHRPLFYQEMQEPYSRIVLWINSDFFQSVAKLCPPDLHQIIRAKEHFLLRTEGTSFRYLENYFKQGLQETGKQAPLWEAALCGNTLILLSHLSRALISTQDSFPIEKNEVIDRIITYLENHYADKITLNDTALKFHISISTLTKLFFSKLGISFYHYVTQRRLINSKLKIEEGSSMEEAALSCGFCDYTAFYRAFKKEYGISPREYKKLISHDIE